MSQHTVLVADDTELIRNHLVRTLQAGGYQVLEAGGLAQAMALVQTRSFDVAFIDLDLGDGDGRDLLDAMRELAPEVPAIIVTATDTAASAVDLIRRGAYDYMVKPVAGQDLLWITARGVELCQARRALNALRAVRDRESGGWDIGETARMRTIEHTVNRFAPTDAGILIEGESGTGKEAVARALHNRSLRAKGPFVALNCAAMPTHLLESTLFGHEKGAFTGAFERRKGMLELAHGGTLFLDEVITMTPEMQAKLLRALQEFRFFRVGGQQELSVDVRVIAACNKSVKAAMAKGEFREDLYYRLCVMSIELPPLRERAVDIPFFIQKFVEELRGKSGSGVSGITEAALWPMCRYPWPGNIRELRNTVERAMIFASGEERIDVQHLPGEVLDAGLGPRVGGPSLARPAGPPPADGPAAAVLTPAPPVGPGAALPERGLDMKGAIARWERDLVCQALERTTGNQSAAARLLGLTRDELRYRVDKYGLDLVDAVA